MSENPVLVVGAGPTGLVLALELVRRGVACRLVDRRPEPLGRDRAIVVKSRSLEVLAGMGLANTFVRRGHIIRGLDLFSGGTKVATIGLDGLDSPFAFDLCLPEEETERILTEALEQLGGRVERGVELTGLEPTRQGARARLRPLGGDVERILDASWVVGTDGLHSAVRAAIGDEFEGHEYPTLWSVADAHLAGWRQPGHHATVQIEAPIAIAFPLRDGRWRFTFQADAEDDALEIVAARLAAISPGVALQDPDEPQHFHTHARVAHRYRFGRVLLAGDAAHASTPFEGHGMNTGIQDSYNLGWKLALVVTGAAPETLLNSYEAERRPIAQAIARSGDDAEARAAKRDPAATQGLMALLATPEGRRLAAIAEAEIAFGYDQSPIVDEVVQDPGTARGGTEIGFRVGDAAPLEGADGAFRLHQLIGVPGHTLLLMLGDADPTALDQGLALAKGAAQRHRPHVQAYVATRNPWHGDGSPSELLRDPTGALHERLGADRPSLCLVRPDGHLGLRAEPPSVDVLEAHLRRIFLSG